MSIGLASILLIGIGANFPNPGTFVQVNFAAGPTGGEPAPETLLILGNKTSSGSATPDTVVYGPDTSTAMQTEADVISLFGPGSQVHRAWKRANKINKQLPIYAVAVTESAGAQAFGQVLVTGTATSGGNVRYYYADDFVDVSVAVGDTASTIGDNLVTAINNHTEWGVTAVNTSGAVSVTAKNHGPEGNWLKHQVLLGPGFVPAGVAVSVQGTKWHSGDAVTTSTFTYPTVANGFYFKVTTAGSGTIGTSEPTWTTTIGSSTVADSNGVIWTCWGTISGTGIATLGGGVTADNVTAALATIVATQYYNILVCDSDATNVGRVVTQVTSQANPTPGIRQRVIFGSSDSLSNAISVAHGLNSPRAELIWGGASTDVAPVELAATLIGVYTLYEGLGATGYRLVGRLNFSRFPTANVFFNDSQFTVGGGGPNGGGWLVGTRNGPAGAPTVANITSALNNGVTPISVLANGTARLEKAITTRSLNGSTQDFRIRDHHKVPIMDQTASEMVTLTDQQFAAKDLLDPPKQGQSPAAGQPPNIFATNVNIWGNALKDLVTKIGDAGLLQDTVTTNANAIVQRETTPRDRMSASFDLVTADIFDQGCIMANQVG
jgi:phage tail sheath gpL-like